MKTEYSTPDALPGVKQDSDLRSIYNDLKTGKVLTSLDAVRNNHTVNLTTYISVLRHRYGVPIQDRWVAVESGKRVKEYFIESEK